MILNYRRNTYIKQATILKFFQKIVDTYITTMLIYNTSSVRSMKRQNARVAQRWSTSLPRRGSRVRSPSRALEKSSDTEWYRCFFFESNPGLEGSVSRPPKVGLGRFGGTKVRRTFVICTAGADFPPHPSRV